MTILCHKKSTEHSVLQISVFRNKKCAEVVSFPKDGHHYNLMNFDGGI